MNREDCYPATDPSDHNSLFVYSRVDKQRHELRKLKRWQRRDRDGLKVQESEGEAKSKDGDLEERYASGRGHDAAFMVPVPLIYGYGSP